MKRHIEQAPEIIVVNHNGNKITRKLNVAFGKQCARCRRMPERGHRVFAEVFVVAPVRDNLFRVRVFHDLVIFMA